MIRMGVQCPGCEQSIAIRMATDTTSGTRFYFACPHCRLPIRGLAAGNDISDYTVTFDAQRLPDAEIESAQKVVTVNPFVPADFSADTHDALGGFSMMTLSGLIGERVIEFTQERGTALQVIQELWPQTRRLYEYYLDENWDAFEAILTRDFGDWGFPSGRTVHERASAAHSAVLAVTAHIVPPSEATSEFLLSFNSRHLATVSELRYSSMLKSESSVSEIQTLQRAVFDVLDLFLLKHEMWIMGSLKRFCGQDGLAELERMTLARDEFGETRDLYQQGFEALCKVLRYPIALRNTIERGDPDDFGDDHPKDVPSEDRVNSLEQFTRLSNAYKLRYLQLEQEWAAFGTILNSRTRNMIGHGAVRHNLRTGRIESTQDPNGVNYVTFLGNLNDLFDALSIATQLLRTVRITSSTDWAPRSS